LLALKGKKAELGRACILKNYRKGVVLGLLWKRNTMLHKEGRHTIPVWVFKYIF